MTNKILITGGAGYVGSVVARHLLRLGYHVRVLDSLLHGGNSLLGLYLEDKFEFMRGDIRDKGITSQALLGIDSVVHLAAIVGEGALSDLDRKFLDVANNFEQRFVNQGIDENRPIEQTLSIGWELLSDLSENELTRIKPEFIAKYAKADTQWWKKPHDRR